MFRADNNGVLTWISPSVERLLGWSAQEVVHTDFLSYVYEDDRPQVAQIRHRVMAGEPVVMEFRAKHRQGDYVWVSSAVRPLFDEQRSIVGRVGSWRDATDRHLAQQRLTEAKERFRHLAENASDVMYLVDEDFRIRWIAPAVEKALGWSSDELVGTRIDDLLHPDELAAVEAQRTWLLADREPPVGPPGSERRLRTKSGGFRWFSGWASRLIGSDGKLQGLVVGLRDVHDLVVERERATRGERRLAAVLETLLDPHLTLDAVRDDDHAITDFLYVDANTAACDYLGMVRERLIGMRLLELLPDHKSGLFERYVKVIETGEPLVLDDYPFTEGVSGMTPGDHAELFLDIRASRVEQSLNLAFRDVTERHQAQLKLAQSQDRYRRLAENAADVVYELGLDGRLAWVSPSVTHALGWSTSQVLGRHVARFVHPEDLARSESGPGGSREARLKSSDGRWRWMRISGRVLRDADGNSTGFIETAHDIQAEMDARLRLAHQIDHDPLTGLPNRKSLLEELQAAVEVPSRRVVSLLTVGIDDLGAVVDAFTHTASDRVIAHVAERLRSLPGITKVARLSDDEFAVVLPFSDMDSMANLADGVKTTVAAPTQIGGHDIDVTVSIGMATRSDATNAEEWLRNCSTALHHAKSLGGNRWEFHDAAMGKAARERVIVRGAIRDAMSAGQFQPWFQPVVSLADRSIAGWEALARWITNDGTVVGPDAFIPAAAHANLIVELDRTMLNQALEMIAGRPRPEWVSVNTSAASLSDPGLVQCVCEALNLTGAKSEQLQMEITETSLMRDTEATRRNMNELAQMGISWWVDDFGTGYSSISHLRDLPIRGLKLDRTFTHGMTTDTTRSGLAQGLVGLAAGLGLQTVAEGVETEEEAVMLKQQGWQMGQGWLFGRPAPAR